MTLVMINNFFNFIKILLLKVKYKDNLEINRNVILPKNYSLVLEKNSKIVINSGVILKENIELRSINNSKLIIGDNVKLDKNVRIIATNGKTIKIGRETRIGLGSVFNGGGNINIGNQCLISGYVYIQTSMHNHKGPGEILDNGYIYGDINIGKGSWLGVHSVIFPNVSLGDRTIVGSNAVVNKSFKSRSIIGGIPAEIIK